MGKSPHGGGTRLGKPLRKCKHVGLLCTILLLNESVYLRKYLRSVRRQLKLEDRSKIVHAVADVIKSDTRINVLEIDFFYQVANALRITLDYDVR